MKKIGLVLLCILLTGTLQSQWKTITNGVMWKDTNGNDIQAHGAGILNFNSTWYMIGEDRSGSGGVNMYSSTDLVTWKFENQIITKNTCTQLQDGSRFIERPKLIYNSTTKQFVVWLHWEGANYAPSEAGVFYCNTVNGNYTFHKGFRPFNNMSRDCNVFVDDNGKAYFISSARDNKDLILYELTDDFLDVKSQVITLWPDGWREAPVIAKKGNYYYLISSGCTGWTPNQAKYAYATSISGPWSALMDIGNKLAFDTQPTAILSVTGTQGTTYVYCGDRWQDPGLSESKTIMFPVEFNGTSMTFDYTHQWDLDITTGLWRITPRDNFVPKANWKVKYASSAQTGNEALKAIDGNESTYWHTQWSGTAPSYPHEIQVDMGQAYDVTGCMYTPRNDKDVNGTIRDFQLYLSSDGTNWGTPVAGGWLSWQTEVTFNKVNARYFRLVALSEISDNIWASAAELDMIQNTVCQPQTISPYYQINSEGWKSSTNISINKGSKLTFGPQPSGSSWSWHGPNGFVSLSREVIINNIQINSSGSYVALYKNKYGHMSIITFDVSVNNSSPAVSLTSPKNGVTLLAGADVTVSATASDSDGSVTLVEFYSGASKIGEDATSPYSFVWSNATAGTNSLTAVAIDNDDAKTTSSAVTIEISCVPPAIIPFTQVNDGAWSQTANVSVIAGDKVNIDLKPDLRGSWSWSGPNGYSDTSKKLTITDIQNNQAGAYMATYTNSCGELSNTTIQVSVGVTGFEPVGQSDVKITPNPGKNWITICLPDAYVNRPIKLFNSMGHELIRIHKAKTINQINISGFKPGIYLVNICTISKKIIKD